MSYEAPEIRDYGDLLELTRAVGAGGPEDGGAKSITVDVDPAVQATVTITP